MGIRVSLEGCPCRVREVPLARDLTSPRGYLRFLQSI